MTITLGLIEKVKINGKEVLAKIDTGADKNSLDITLANKLNIKNFIKTIKVRSPHGRSTRQVVEADLEIKGKKIKTQFNLIDRSQMNYPVLIGNNVLKKGFIIKP